MVCTYAILLYLNGEATSNAQIEVKFTVHSGMRGSRPIMAINCVKKPLFYHDESSGRMYLTLKLTLQNLQKIDDSCLKPPPT